MIDGARKMPLQHLSIRVPWHQNGWDGTVCPHVAENTSCLALPRIGEDRDDAWEGNNPGQPWNVLGKLPVCADERAGFMAPFSYTRRAKHPYSHNPAYGHFRETEFEHKPYSAAAIPFGWMLKPNPSDGGDGPAPKLADQLSLGYRPEVEPELGFSTWWVQDHRNQLVMLDTFFDAVKPEESLVFFYAKRTPLTEDPRRVIVGMGRVLNVEGHVEYQYENRPKDGLRCVLWERNVHHSIRPTMTDGFLLPYQQLLAMAEDDPTLDPADFVLHAPQEWWDNFSMGAEHVPHDAAITTLVSSARTIERIAERIPGDWEPARKWIDQQLNRLWQLRGAYPGLGSALTALGIPHGTLVAHAVGGMLENELEDPWPVMEACLRDPSKLPGDLGRHLGENALRHWENLPTERRTLLQFIARFSLTEDQAKRWFVREERQRQGIDLEDRQILENPYVLYEQDRGRVDPVAVGTVDRGVFPNRVIEERFPGPDPPGSLEPIDPRRVRALASDVLGRAAGEGHSLLPQDWLVSRMRDLDIQPECPVDGDWFQQIESSLEPFLNPQTMKNGAKAWQLAELDMARQIIAREIRSRAGGKRHSGEHDWRSLIDARLPEISEAGDPEREDRAREEKAAVLKELFESRVSVLVGSAGTGKTTLLSTLLSVSGVDESSTLLLAPTGKARVQMQRVAGGAKAQTVAQFLRRLERYQPETGLYVTLGRDPKESGYKTVIIDECSMLTEPMLAATLDALKGVQRLVLVGDYRQLPPIGPGRPFADIVRFLAPEDVVQRFPRVGRCYGELNIPRRYEVDSFAEGVRDDRLLADWFSGEPLTPTHDEVWDRIARGESDVVQALGWDNPDELESRLLSCLHQTLQLESEEDEDGFEESLGGQRFKNAVYFHSGKNGNPGAGAGAENWQILSPRRSGQTGTEGLNRTIQHTFRKRVHSWAESGWKRKIPKPMGPDSVLYGDKVINTKNDGYRRTYPKVDGPYLANGEIGIVTGQYKGAKFPKVKLPWELEVEFSTQPGLQYKFGKADFKGDSEPPLELAYALTVHKAQGSEFKTTFFVVPDACQVLSKELFYTALTRHSGRIVILHQGELPGLSKWSSTKFSDTARRVTNLLDDPLMVTVQGEEVQQAFLEDSLIHRTRRGELVRSKSEVAIADLLDHLGLDYDYEHPFEGGDGGVRYPDFTVEDAATGRTVLIEHLGLLGHQEYEKAWVAKLQWYREQGVVPVEENPTEEAVAALLCTDEREGLDMTAIERGVRHVMEG